jgi:hypothetical protein
MKTAPLCLEVSNTYFGSRFVEIRGTAVYPFYSLFVLLHAAALWCIDYPSVSRTKGLKDSLF